MGFSHMHKASDLMCLFFFFFLNDLHNTRSSGPLCLILKHIHLRHVTHIPKYFSIDRHGWNKVNGLF